MLCIIILQTARKVKGEFAGGDGTVRRGTAVRAGEPAGFVQTRYGMEPVLPPQDGRIIGVFARQGDKVAKGEIVAFFV